MPDDAAEPAPAPLEQKQDPQQDRGTEQQPESGRGPVADETRGAPPSLDAGHPQKPEQSIEQGPDNTQAPLPTADRRKLRWAGIVAAIVFAAILAIGTATRVIARQNLHRTTQSESQLSVTAVHPTLIHGTTLTLPARLDAWTEAPVYARTDGYLLHWYADIGTPVHAGTVLADIDTPEVNQQLAASRAALATAQANLNLAAITANRWNKLLAQNAVSKQDADDRRGDYAAKFAMRNQAQAEVDRLLALTSFQQVIAPFDGVVTARNTDIGDLISAGQGAARALFTISDLSRLRIYVSVPQTYLATISTGLTAHFTVPEMQGRTFAAQISRTARAVDPQAGAMLVQLTYDNSAGVLRPGEYADITFDLPSQPHQNDLLQIPADTLLFRKDGTTVAVVGPDGKVSIHKISIATDLGTDLQISSGLSRDDLVIDNPDDGIENGDHVKLQQQSSKPHA